MTEPVTTTTTAIKVGTMVATGGLLADLIIFNDVFYFYLAIVGALVSTFGVMHEILKNRPIEHTMGQILAEVSKGLVLGITAIPFWYLVLSSIGEALVTKLFNIPVSGMANSVWLMVSFVASWYTVPIFDWIVSKIKRKAKDV